ncbi:MAG: hypothetical protein QOF91_3775 [Alphaproteobacteria bacterium]|jgi:hypothetical protein|nr:hypothetical protein [Alphaproteobacteria bacterium]MEA3028490.1 hypothetical protein [Alphaproteobacteria bacterium]
MERVALVAALLYGWGTPAFDGLRPEALDRPLRNLHRTVNAAATDGRRALSTVEGLRAWPNLAASLRRLNEAL